MKQVHPNYTFVASTKTITLTGLNIPQDQLLLITNATRGVIYYNFASSSHKATVTAGANTTVVLTDASTTGHADNDQLVIHYEDQIPAGAVTVGNSVTIGSLPAISGTVTANLGDGIASSALNAGDQTKAVAVQIFDEDGNMKGGADGLAVNPTGLGAALANFANNEGVSSPLPISGTVTVGNSVTIGFLPAISGTVTANLSSSNLNSVTIGVRGTVTVGNTVTISGTVTANGNFIGTIGDDPSAPPRAIAVGFLDASQSGNFVGVDNDDPNRHFPVKVGGSLPAISGTVTANNSVLSNVLEYDGNNYFLRIGGRTAGGRTDYPIGVAGTVTIGNSVTIGSLPNGALTTRFGSVTTANTAQITSAVTNSNRKYLLAQNISAGTVTIGIGFSPTTTQGIQLPAGAGLTFDAFCPTGAVYWLGAVTGAAWTILEG